MQHLQQMPIPHHEDGYFGYTGFIVLGWDMVNSRQMRHADS
jgi:hypothetical protein